MRLLDYNSGDLTPGGAQPVDGFAANPNTGFAVAPRTPARVVPSPTSSLPALPTALQVATAGNNGASSGMTSDAGAFQQQARGANGEQVTYFGAAIAPAAAASQPIGQEFAVAPAQTQITPAPSSGTPAVTPASASGGTTTPNTTGGGGGANVAATDTNMALLNAIDKLFGNQDVQAQQLAPVQLAPTDGGDVAPAAATGPNYQRIVMAALVLAAIGAGWWFMRKRTH